MCVWMHSQNTRHAAKKTRKSIPCWLYLVRMPGLCAGCFWLIGKNICPCAGVKELFIVCCSHSSQIEDYITKLIEKKTFRCSIQVIEGEHTVDVCTWSYLYYRSFVCIMHVYVWRNIQGLIATDGIRVFCCFCRTVTCIMYSVYGREKIVEKAYFYKEIHSLRHPHASMYVCMRVHMHCACKSSTHTLHIHPYILYLCVPHDPKACM